MGQAPEIYDSLMRHEMVGDCWMGSIKSTSKRVYVEVQPSIALVEVEKGPPKGMVGIWPHRQAAMQLSGNMALLSTGPMVGQAESVYHHRLH